MAASSGPPLELDIQLAGDAPAPPAGADFAGWIQAALRGAAEARPDGARPGTSLAGAVSVRLVGLEEGAALNATWRHKAGPTNVLAFPGPVRPPGLPPGSPEGVPVEYGDLVICLPVVAREAAEQAKEPLQHLAHLVVHGTLHLLGYTHHGDADAAVMEALETRVLGGLGIPDPYVTR